MIADQVKRVGDGGQRVVDLVSDNPGDAPHGCQLFGLAKGLFGVQLGGNIAAHLEDRVALLVQVLAAGNNNLAPVAGPLYKVALPCPVFAQRRLNLFAGHGKLG